MKPLIPNRFDPGNAAELVCASAFAYGDARGLPGGLESTWIESATTDTRVLLLRAPDDLIVAFRGTADIRNWLTDLDCQFTRDNGCRVHAGFAAALASVQEPVADGISGGAGGGRRLWLTGHSLGGALAMLFAWRFVRRRGGPAISGVYTFGQPRVGDAGFRDSYNFSGLRSRTFRVLHSADIVPHIPCLLGLYRHPRHEIFFDDARQWREDAPFLWKVKGEIAANFHRLTRFRSAELEDHRMDTYLNLFHEPEQVGRENWNSSRPCGAFVANPHS